MDESLLLSLTDDALLAVLAYLSGEELLRCRRVCRRFRRLCLHPDLWRNVQLWHDEGRNVLRAALSLAPCLGFLGCMSYSESCLPAVADTTCVVTNLSLYLSNESDFAPATAIIQKCGSLGGLRLLELHVRFHSKECRELTMALLRAAFNIHGLQELLVFNQSNNPLLDVTGNVDVKPSLTRLVYGCLPTADPFLLLLLKTHAATLQRVELVRIDVPPVSLLAKIHGLRSLRCYPSEESSQLASLRNLESIEWLSCDNTVAVSGASDFIRQAQHLRSVKIRGTFRNREAVLRSVVESRSAGLIETLECGFYGEPPASDIWGLCMAPALANFRSLKHLNISDEATDVFLQAITPTSAPSLTRLQAPCPKETCTHAWLHSPAVQDVLTRNPSLHLQNNNYFNIRDDCSCSCPWCRWGCHKALRKWWFQTCASAHSRRASCPPHCLQVAVSTCPSCGHLTSSTM